MLPQILIQDKESADIIHKEITIIYNSISFFTDYFCTLFKMDRKIAGDLLIELFENKEISNLCTIRCVSYLNEQFFLKLKTSEGYIAAPGTVLNAALLYLLVRYFKLKNVFESGTASGFYSNFIVYALQKNGDGHLDTVDLLSDGVGESIIWKDSPFLTIHKQTNSINFLREKNQQQQYYDLYSHDSQHVFTHMFSELREFKKCDKDRFLCFFDDQRTENFWDRCIKMKLFDRSDYDVRFTEAAEQLGGFLQYVKR